MTYEGALYWHTHNGATIEQEIDCEILIKEALEKQIPKKPVVKYLYDKNGKIYDSEYHCSVCGRFICYTTELDIYNTYPYCHCGQAIDFDKE